MKHNDMNRNAPTLEELLHQALRRIQVEPPELDEARARRAAIRDALLSEFPGARVYFNGSVAHGDALTPLTDVDLGIVIPDPNRVYGPGRRGPRELKQHAADAIREKLRPTYGEPRVEVEGRKRSILIRFRDPVAPGRPDFTADVIVAIDNPDDEGLFIPRWDSWDRSHPEKHTELVLTAIERTEVVYARAVRLMKHWMRTHDKPLCSWHVKALALGCITYPMTLLDALRVWFRFAATDLNQQDTPDPAGVAPHPLRVNQNMTRSQVVRMLREAGERLEHAVRLEAAGYRLLAHDELAKLFNDPEMLPRPDQDAVRRQEADRIAAEKAKDTERLGSIALLTGVGEGAIRPRPNNRSWGPEAPAAPAELPLDSQSNPVSMSRRSTGLDWFGARAEWWVPFERDARRRYGDQIEIIHEYRRVTYRHVGLEVPGRLDPVPVVVEFFAEPPYATYGMRPWNYPRVWADPAGVSPHRMPDRSLCLYYPGDPPERLWRSELGLLSLLDLTRDHVFFEHHWRETGGFRHGVWLGPEAAHGGPHRRAA